MGMPSYFSNLSMFNAKKPPPHHHDMEGKTLLAFRRIVPFIRIIGAPTPGIWTPKCIAQANRIPRKSSASI